MAAKRAGSAPPGLCTANYRMRSTPPSNLTSMTRRCCVTRAGPWTYSTICKKSSTYRA